MGSKKRVLGILLGFILVFVLFLYLLLRPSAEAKAINAVSGSMNIEDIKSAWYKYKDDIYGTQPNRSDILGSDFIKTVYAKLDELRPASSDINNINEWLPAQENLNIIIVPDLSRRIKDSVENPEQVKNDTTLLNTIWNAFEEATKLKMNSKDRLLVDVSDPGQSQGQFRKIADDLVFDLKEHKNKSNRLFFPGKKEIFKQKTWELYQTALQQTTGADYRYYFGKVLPTRIKKNTVSDKYRNILLIPTDGYLEVTVDNNGVSVTPPANELRAYCQGRVPPIQLPLETMDMVFPNVEVYLFEVHERRIGQGCDAKGLKNWWKEWFKHMEIQNVSEDNFFNEQQEAISHTQNRIDEIIR